MTKELVCFRAPGWEPNIRPAESTRPWMDATPEKFAYRCLPLAIANMHGWEILSPCDARAYWLGGPAAEDVMVQAPQNEPGAPVTLFGQGTLTFHIQGLFRTPPGWALWVGGSPNRPKDAIAPLTGIVETSWAPYTFTMNWKFTRRNTQVLFEKDEPICFIFPIRLDAIEEFQPLFANLQDDPELHQQFAAWSESRWKFHEEIARNPPTNPSDKWQKKYYRGLDMKGKQAHNHRIKLRLKGFAR